MGIGTLNFTLQWQATHRGSWYLLWALVCLYKRCLSKGEGTYTPAAFSTLLLCRIAWWVGHPLLGRGRIERSKWQSFRLNVHDITGLNTQRVFKCDCSGILFLHLWSGFAAAFASLLSTLAHVCLVYSLFMLIQRTDLPGNRAASLPAAFRSPSAWGIHVLSYEMERGSGSWHIFVPIRTAAALSSICWSDLNHEKHLMATSSGTLRGTLGQTQPHWFPEQRPDEWVLKSIHLLIASVSKQQMKSSRVCQCLCRNMLLKEGRAGRRRSSLNLWGKIIRCK